MATYIHPTADVSPDAVLGEGTKIWHQAQVREGAVLGKNCIIGKSAYIGADVKMGDGCKVQNHSDVYKGVCLGNEVFVGPCVCFTNDFYPRAHDSEFEVYETKVEDGVSVGANSTIVCGIRIGANAMVGAGSVVTKDVPPHALVVGNPARMIARVCRCGHKLSDDLVCGHCGTQIKLEE